MPDPRRNRYWPRVTNTSPASGRLGTRVSRRSAAGGRARRLGRLGIGCAEQRLVGGAEVGRGQATRVQLPDLFGYGDSDLDVLAAAGGVEVLGVRVELGLGVQWFVADREQGGGG